MKIPLSSIVARRTVLRAEREHAKSIYEILAVADIMRPVYERTNKADGYVSIEVSPFIAHETDATIAEARRLWLAIGRSNVMIKVPATPEGVPAIRQLISEGINVNITLLFAIEGYERIADAYLTGLEARAINFCTMVWRALQRNLRSSSRRSISHAKGRSLLK